MLKTKNIIIFISLALFLTGCTAQVEELKEKVQTQKSETEVSEEKGVFEEEEKDPSEMSLDELEEELESMEDIEVEEGLDDLEEEL